MYKYLAFREWGVGCEKRAQDNTKKRGREGRGGVGGVQDNEKYGSLICVLVYNVHDILLASLLDENQVTTVPSKLLPFDSKK